MTEESSTAALLVPQDVVELQGEGSPSSILPNNGDSFASSSWNVNMPQLADINTGVPFVAAPTTPILPTSWTDDQKAEFVSVFPKISADLQNYYQQNPNVIADVLSGITVAGISLAGPAYNTAKTPLNMLWHPLNTIYTTIDALFGTDWATDHSELHAPDSPRICVNLADSEGFENVSSE